MRKTLVFGVATVAVAASAVAFLGSSAGLKPGDRVTPFHPKHVSGPLANSDKCFPCTYQQRPQVQVWVSGDSEENVAKIAANLQKQIEKHKGAEFKAMIVWLTDDAKAAKPILMNVAKSAKDVAVAYLPKNDEAVAAYKIDKSNKNTVVVYKDWKVSNAMANLKADEAGLAALNAEIAKIAK